MGFGTVSELIGISVGNGAYAPYSAPNGRGVAALPWPEGLPPPAEAVSFFDSPDARTAKKNAKMEAMLRDGFFFKRYRCRGPWEDFKNLFRPGRPAKVLAAFLKMQQIGLRVPEVILAGQDGRDGILVTRALPSGAVPWNKLAMTLTREKEFDLFLETTLDALSRMHRNGIAHGDFNLRNLFDDHGKLWIIDWDGVTIYPGRKGVPKFERQKEIARLASSLFRCWFFGDHKTTAADRRRITARLVKRYAELSGIDLAGGRIDRRVEYLTNRLRKDGADDWLRQKKELLS